MALTKVTGGTISTTSDYQINNIVGVAATFTTLNVDGVLTYEDVTNIDAVGIITAQKGIHLGAGATVGHLSTVGISTINSLTVNGTLTAGGDVSIGSAVSAVDNKSAMNIYATGAIVQPKQPRFLAYRGSTDHSVTGSGLITAWNNVKYDVGSNFSSGTKFTAPVTGTYMFGCNIRWGCNGKIRVIRVQLDHYNSSNGGKGNYGGGVGGANDFDGGSGYDHPYTSFTNLVEMDAGDYVQIHLQEVAFSGSLFLQSQGFTSNFWGCLMF